MVTLSGFTILGLVVTSASLISLIVSFILWHDAKKIKNTKDKINW
jgi:hypothetical protein